MGFPRWAVALAVLVYAAPASAAAPAAIGRVVSAWPAGSHSKGPTLVGRCAVTPISAQIVVTPAHCVTQYDSLGTLRAYPLKLRIVMGSRDLTRFRRGLQDPRLYKLSSISVPRSIRPGSLSSDVAFVTLSRRFTATAFAFAPSSIPPPPGSVLQTYWWGSYDSYHTTISTKLKAGTVTTTTRLPETTPPPGYQFGTDTFFTHATAAPRTCPAAYDGSPLLDVGPVLSGIVVAAHIDCRRDHSSWFAAADVSAFANPVTRVSLPRLVRPPRVHGVTKPGGKLTCSLPPHATPSQNSSTTYTWHINLPPNRKHPGGRELRRAGRTITVPRRSTSYSVWCSVEVSGRGTRGLTDAWTRSFTIIPG